MTQRIDQSDERVLLRNLLRAHGTDDQDECRLPAPHDEADQLDGLAITPLQIVDDEQARSIADDKSPAHGIAQPMALGRVARGARLQWAEVAAELG